MLRLLEKAHLLAGNYLGIGTSGMEVNAAMKSIVWRAHLRKLANGEKRYIIHVAGFNVGILPAAGLVRFRHPQRLG